MQSTALPLTKSQTKLQSVPEAVSCCSGHTKMMRLAGITGRDIYHRVHIPIEQQDILHVLVPDSYIVQIC